MRYYDTYLKGLENYNSTYPNHIWQYVNDGDLFLSVVFQDSPLKFIVKANGRLKGKHFIGIDFIYSINDDDFKPLTYNAEATVSFLERYPNVEEVKKLNGNVDYLIYLSNNNNYNVT